MEFIKMIAGLFLELLGGLQSSGELSQWQVFFIFLLSMLLLVAFFRTKTILGFVNGMKNSRLNELKSLYYFLDKDSIEARGINKEIDKIVRYRVCGVSDVATQNLIFKLSEKNSDVIAPSFFKKYHIWIGIENGALIFKQGAMFWIDSVFLLFLHFNILLLHFCFYSFQSILAMR